MGGALHGALTASFALSAVLALRPLLQVNLSIGTTFYAIIFVTSVLRTLWLALPLFLGAPPCCWEPRHGSKSHRLNG